MNSIISIITPSYNRADLVLETAASIKAQSYPNWEWVIVDDGSTDNSWDVLEQLATEDSRIKVFKREREPKGACCCRNIAVEKSTGTYVIFLDTDDLLAPFCMEQRLRVIEEYKECDFAIFPMLLFENSRDDLNVLWNVENGTDDLKRILTGDPICQGTGTIWKKESFIKAGMWREDLALWQDIELHIRSLLYPMKYVKKMDLAPDTYLRITPNSLSRGGFYSLPKIKSRLSVLSYACEKLTEKGFFEKYKSEVRGLVADIAISTIISGNFLQTKVAIAIAKEYDLLNKREIRRVKNFSLVRKFKLYKIKSIEQYFSKDVYAVLQKNSNTIGKVKWRPSL